MKVLYDVRVRPAAEEPDLVPKPETIDLMLDVLALRAIADQHEADARKSFENPRECTDEIDHALDLDHSPHEQQESVGERLELGLLVCLALLSNPTPREIFRVHTHRLDNGI
jgi:hypothetical protein